MVPHAHTQELLKNFGLTTADLEMNRHGRLSDTQFDDRVLFPLRVWRFFVWCSTTCGALLFACLLWGLLRGWRALEDVGVFILPLAVCLYASFHLSQKAKQRYEAERSDRAGVQSFDTKVNITHSSTRGHGPGFKVFATDGRVLEVGAALPILETGVLYRFYEYKGEIVNVEALEKPHIKKSA